jgi:hypothetical protein
MQTENNNPVVEEPIKKTSKLKKIASATAVVGMYAIPATIMGVSTYYSVKVVLMNYETAKLQLEAAANAAQK